MPVVPFNANDADGGSDWLQRLLGGVMGYPAQGGGGFGLSLGGGNPAVRGALAAQGGGGAPSPLDMYQQGQAPQSWSPSMQMTVVPHDPYSAAPTPFVGRQPPTLGKGYPSDFTNLYNSFAAAYAKHPAEVANERARGGGAWTSRMQQLDDLKGAQDWVRSDAPRLKRLPLGAQQNIYDSPDTPEGQVPLPPPDPGDPTGQTRARNYGEPLPPPANQYSPQADDIDRLFANQVWGGYLGKGNPFSPTGGWGI